MRRNYFPRSCLQRRTAKSFLVLYSVAYFRSIERMESRNGPTENGHHGEAGNAGGCPMGHGGYPTKRSMPGKGYQEYLMLNQLLDNQQLMTTEYGPRTIHDEMLFIVTHQTYELWFKQIIWELDSVRQILDVPVVSEQSMLTILQRMSRVVLIWKVIVDQLLILETMTPLDFMDFRDYLAPGSGFQSLQFRIIENKLGQKMELRVGNPYSILAAFPDDQSKQQLEKSINEPSLFDLLDKWLSRTPGLEATGFDFPKRYAEAVDRYLQDERRAFEHETDKERRHIAETEWNRQKEKFDSLISEENHSECVRARERRLSYPAMMGALMICCYSEYPRFHIPHQILMMLLDLDGIMSRWRYNHSNMAHRMIGSKTGTGGSSGYYYLRSTVSDRYKIFIDLFNISSFIIPRSFFPPLTPEIKVKLNAEWGSPVKNKASTLNGQWDELSDNGSCSK